MRTWRELQAQKLAAMTPEERAEYDAETPRSRAALAAAELAYEARTAAGLTQEEMGRLMGRKQAYISALESGRANPTISTLDELVRAAGKRLELKIA